MKKLNESVETLLIGFVNDEENPEPTLCVGKYSPIAEITKIINIFKGEEAIDIFNMLTSVEHYGKEER